MKYTRVEDPTERAARLERMRQAEESGQLERSATRIAEKAMAKQKEVLTEKLDEAMPTARIPVSHRLEAPSEAIVQETTPRISVSLRLGDPGNGISTQERELEKSPSTTPRTSAILRLGPLQTEHRPSLEEGPGTKKKRGRPPGSKKVPNSPQTVTGNSSRKRKTTAKPPNCRRRVGTDSKSAGTPTRTLNKATTSRGSSGTSGRTHSSDNVPLRNMIPKTTRKRVDFQDPPLPLP